MEKLKLVAYTDPKFGSRGDEFVASINPEQITLKKGIAYNTEDNYTNSAGNTPKFKGMEDDDLSFDLYLDATGVAGEADNISARIDKLYNVVYYYHGGTHRPNYVKIEYASFQYQATLKSITTTYTLFKSNGEPLRAKISLSFMQFFDPAEVEMKANNQSPDMTHVHTIRVGDHLPLMCKEIYGSMDYYQEIARVNGLTNFRNLEMGSQIVFPPIEK